MPETLRFPARHEGERERAYADAVLREINNINPDLAPFMTTICTECDDLGIKRPNEHVLIGNIVIIGCEGYWLINPALVLDDYEGSWYDWTKGIDGQ